MGPATPREPGRWQGGDKKEGGGDGGDGKGTRHPLQEPLPGPCHLSPKSHLPGQAGPDCPQNGAVAALEGFRTPPAVGALRCDPRRVARWRGGPAVAAAALPEGHREFRPPGSRRVSHFGPERGQPRVVRVPTATRVPTAAVTRSSSLGTRQPRGHHRRCPREPRRDPSTHLLPLPRGTTGDSGAAGTWGDLGRGVFLSPALPLDARSG